MKILDHGYLEKVDVWGSDQSIIEAARMSTQQGFKGWGPKKLYQCTKCAAKMELGDTYEAEGQAGSRGHINCYGRVEPIADTPGDERLLRYLWEHRHATPFEMAGMTVEVQAPIFVFREWHRHRTQSYNEMSARYVPLPHLNYIPTLERLFLTDPKNRQAQGIATADGLNADSAKQWLASYIEVNDHAQRIYEAGLRIGIPKELARLPVPVARYSRMRASANLRNWLQFLTLRMDPAAQWEIRQYAFGVGYLIEQFFPRTWELFVEGIRHG